MTQLSHAAARENHPENHHPEIKNTKTNSNNHRFVDSQCKAPGRSQSIHGHPLSLLHQSEQTCVDECDDEWFVFCKKVEKIAKIIWETRSNTATLKHVFDSRISRILLQRHFVFHPALIILYPSHSPSYMGTVIHSNDSTYHFPLSPPTSRTVTPIATPHLSPLHRTSNHKLDLPPVHFSNLSYLSKPRSSPSGTNLDNFVTDSSRKPQRYVPRQ